MCAMLKLLFVIVISMCMVFVFSGVPIRARQVDNRCSDLENNKQKQNEGNKRYYEYETMNRRKMVINGMVSVGGYSRFHMDVCNQLKQFHFSQKKIVFFFIFKKNFEFEIRKCRYHFTNFTQKSLLDLTLDEKIK